MFRLGCLVTAWLASVGVTVAQVADTVGTPVASTAPPAFNNPYQGPVSTEAVLYNNGPLVTHPGAGPGGNDNSALQTGLGLNIFGYGHQQALGLRVADDFVVPSPGWNITNITFFGYQTNSTTASTINGVTVRIWNQPPNTAGTGIVFGDTTTNRLATTGFMPNPLASLPTRGIYRNSDTAPTNNQRPVMANKTNVVTSLGPGTYWVDWATNGTLTSGPWQPPTTVLGAPNSVTGAGGMQLLTTGWISVTDAGLPQDFPFIIEGEVSGPTPPPPECFAFDNPLGCVDNFTTPDEDALTSLYEFGGANPPIPADFFAPGSQPFTGVIKFKGAPLLETEELGVTDTLVSRGPITFPPTGGVVTVPIELVALSLVGTEPILVDVTPAEGTEEWLPAATQSQPGLGCCGDFDGDGDIDLSDFVQFQLCFGGSNNPPAPSCPPGVDADCDSDGDVDLADFLVFQQCFTGSLAPRGGGPQGTLTATLPSGAIQGSFDAMVPVMPLMAFVKVSDLIDLENGLITEDQVTVRMLDAFEMGIPPSNIEFVGQPFSTQLLPGGDPDYLPCGCPPPAVNQFYPLLMTFTDGDQQQQQCRDSAPHVTPGEWHYVRCPRRPPPVKFCRYEVRGVRRFLCPRVCCPRPNNVRVNIRCTNPGAPECPRRLIVIRRCAAGGPACPRRGFCIYFLRFKGCL